MHKNVKRNIQQSFKKTFSCAVAAPSEGFIHLVRTQNFRKANISYTLIRTRTCVYQGVRNVSFSECFAYVLNE